MALAASSITCSALRSPSTTISSGTLALAWRRAELSPRHRALAEFASKLTLHPADVDANLMDGLRAAGLGEEEILEAVQVVAIYNSNNRINNALGMQPNDEARPGFQPAR